MERTRRGVASASTTRGQLFLEEYYTLALIGEAGIGTPHMDGNTRLCTATAAVALIESFGSDGQPGSYADFDITDALFHVGHNMATTQTVLWARVLDRLAGRTRRRLVVVDPRATETAKRGRRPPRPAAGTNLPLLNGLLHVLHRGGGSTGLHRDAHRRLRDARRARPSAGRPERGRGASRASRRRTLRGGGRDPRHVARRLVSTVLQGVYQSMQATAAACQVNNLHLIRGLIGKPGSRCSR